MNQKNYLKELCKGERNMKKLVVGNWKQNNIGIDYKEYIEKLENVFIKILYI